MHITIALLNNYWYSNLYCICNFKIIESFISLSNINFRRMNNWFKWTCKQSKTMEDYKNIFRFLNAAVGRINKVAPLTEFFYKKILGH